MPIRLTNTAGQRIAIGTHGDIMTLMLNGFDVQYDFEFWRRLTMPDVYCAVFAGGRFVRAERVGCDA